VTQRSLADPRYWVSVWGSWTAEDHDFCIASAAVYTPLGLVQETQPWECLHMGVGILHNVIQARREGVALRLVDEAD
jgi:hypothetical protein